MVRIGINGFGRIGRCALRIAVKNPEVEVVAVNARSGIDTYAHLLKYDTVHGTFDEEVSVDGDIMHVGDKAIKFTRYTDPKEIPWGELGVDVVLETTGKFKTRETVQPHLDNGAKKVLIACPAKGEDITIVLGVNEDKYDPKKDHIISNASCTTNCLAPFTKVLEDNFGMESGINTGVIAKYSSNDLKTWKDEGIFFENDMGNDSNMECPTVLKYKDKWYLSFSDQWPNRQVHYRISDSLDGTFEKPANDVFDCNGFYAGRLETDGDNLYVVGWCGTKKNHQDGDEYDWGGNMVTHMLKQNSDGTLNAVIPPAIESTMKNECTLSPVKMTDTVKEKAGSYTFSGNDYETVGFKNIMGSYLFETTVSDYDENGMFGLCFNTNEESVGNINILFNAATNKIEFYNTSDIVQVTAQSSLDYDLSKADKLHIKAVIADGVCVCYVNDEVAFTTRMYLSQGSQWGLFSIKSPVTFKDTKLYK